MGTRAYRRDSRGRFAGSSGGGGTKITYGKAGGFANASFRARVAAARGSSAGLGTKTKSAVSSVNKRLAAPQAQRSRGNKSRIQKDLRKGLALGVATAGLGLASNRAARQGRMDSAILMTLGTSLTARASGHYLGNAAGTAVNRKIIASRRAKAAARPKIQAGKKVKR